MHTGGPGPAKGPIPALRLQPWPSAPRAQTVLWAEGAEKRRVAAAAFPVNIDHTEKPPHAPSDRRGCVPTDQVLHSPQESPCPSDGRAGWQAGSGQQLSAQQEMIEESAFFREAALPALGASCPPSSCGGKRYRRAHTRRTRSQWREQPSAGWGTGP